MQEALGVPIVMDAKRPTPRHIIIKRPKGKDRDSLRTLVWGMLEGGGVVGWRGAKAEKQDNCNSISNKIKNFKRQAGLQF